MGQKVNPIAFRTGVVTGWKSRWYASKQEFAELLVEIHGPDPEGHSAA